jgi:hypothetical protein
MAQARAPAMTMSTMLLSQARTVTWPLPLKSMTRRSSSRNGSLGCLCGDVMLLLVGLLHFGKDFHRHSCIGFLAGISD